MNEVYKYCKFCNETKNINDFCKSGMFVKNICKECWNKKTRERYKNSKLVEEKDKEIERLKKLYETDKESWKEQMYELQERIDKAIKYITSVNLDDSDNIEDLLAILKGEKI